MGEKIKILIVAKSPVGGIRTFLKYVYSKFVTEEYSLTYLLPENDNISTIKNDFNSQDMEFVLLQEGSKGFHYIQKIFRLSCNNRFDIIHAQGFSAGLYSVLPSMIFRVPLVMTIHSMLGENNFSGGFGFLKKLILSIVYSFVSCIHCVSNDAKENICENLPFLNRFKKKLVTIQNGIDVERFFVNETEDFRATLDLPEDAFLIGFFGRFMPVKGFGYLADAIELLKEKQLPRTPIVLCFGWGAFIREEQKGLKKRGLWENFRFMEYRENIAAALRGLDVVVMPSLSEACPLLPMESLVAGTPFIGTNCMGLREVLENTPSKLVQPGCGSALAFAIEKEMWEPTKQQSLDFREKARSRFDVNKQVVGIKNLFLEQLKPK